MRDKSSWGSNAILADILTRLGLELAKKKLWSQYILLFETTGPGCELAEKAANLLFLDETLTPILKELGDFYVKSNANPRS